MTPKYTFPFLPSCWFEWFVVEISIPLRVLCLSVFLVRKKSDEP